MAKNDLIGTVMARLSAQISISDQKIAENEELVQVLNSMVDMAKQLKENDSLDEAVDNKRSALNEIEDNIEKAAREGKQEKEAVAGEIKASKELRNSVQKDTDAIVKDIHADGERKIAERKKFIDGELEKGDEILADCTERIGRAKSECDEIENKSKSMKDELIAKL